MDILNFIYIGIYWNKFQCRYHPQHSAENLIVNPPMRKMMNFSVLLLACGMSLQANAGTNAGVDGGWFAPQGSGFFSAVAQNACRGAATTPPDLVVQSPNGRRKIVVRTTEDEAKTFAVDEVGGKFPLSTEGWPCPEIGWSSASDVFFVNYSDGGNVGTYHVGVYRLSKGKLAEIHLTSAVRRDFQSRYPKCFRPERANIAGIAWANDAARLLVAAEILPHSNCDNMGTFMLYEVAVPSGAIIRRFSQVEAKTLFHGLLGAELQAADDGCFSKPGSCFIPMLHEAKDARPIR